jgi:hypothetical protein
VSSLAKDPRGPVLIPRAWTGPMPAWVYQTGHIFYVKLCGVHEDFDEKRLDDLKGEWAGPISPRPVFEERESNP